MTTEEFTDPGAFPVFTTFVKIGRDESIVFRTDTAEELTEALLETVAVKKEIKEALDEVKSAFAVAAPKPAAASEDKAARGGRQVRGGGGSSRGNSGSRTASARPGSRTKAKRDDPPLSDELCDCGEPYKDLNGMTYKSGAKAGQLYPNRFYASCDNRACKPWGDQE